MIRRARKGFMPDVPERPFVKNGVKNVKMAGPGAYSRTIPNELINPYVCGMGNDNLYAKGEIETPE